MNIIIRYDKNKDIECWNRLIDAKSMFGITFPKYSVISAEKIFLARKKVKKFQAYCNNYSNFEKKIKEIYKSSLPKSLNCYINTSGFSMDNYPEYISISFLCNTEEDFLTKFIHEVSHFMFRKNVSDFCYSIGCNDKDIEEIKEIVTIINNDVFKRIDDKGYDVHDYYRKKTLEAWRNGWDIFQIVLLIKKLFLEKSSK